MDDIKLEDVREQTGRGSVDGYPVKVVMHDKMLIKVESLHDVTYVPLKDLLRAIAKQLPSEYMEHVTHEMQIAHT